MSVRVGATIVQWVSNEKPGAIRTASTRLEG
jgi:hypothetical protein